MKKNGITVEEIFVGQYKRLATPFKTTTDSEREKVKEHLFDAHAAFKAFLLKHRKNIGNSDIESISTGEVSLISFILVSYHNL